jgi:integrase
MKFQHGRYWHRPRIEGKQKWTGLSRDLSEALAEYRIRECTQGGPGSISQLIARYREEVLPLKKTAATMRMYDKGLERMEIVFGHFLIEELRSEHIYQWLDHPNNRGRPISANRDISCLSHVLSKARRWGLIDRNICQKLEKNGEPPRETYVDDDLYVLIRNAMPKRIQIAMDFTLLTSLRKSDVLKVKQSDVVNQNGVSVLMVSQQKLANQQGGSYSIAIDDKLLEVFARAREHNPVPEGYLVQKPTAKAFGKAGDPYATSGFDSIWQRRIARLKKDYGIPDIRWHDIRAKAASDLESPYHAHRLLGHKSMSTTENYLRNKKRNKVASTGQILR